MVDVMVLTKKVIVGRALQIVLNNFQKIHADLAAEGKIAINSENTFDVILIDVDIGDFERSLVLKSPLKNNKIIMIKFLENDFLEYQFVLSTCLGYVLQTKEVSVEGLYADILGNVTGKHSAQTPETAKVCKLFSELACPENTIQVEEDSLQDISSSEWDIIRNIGLGLTNKEISAKMYLSVGTVRNYLSNILSKLNFRDRTQLAIWANQSGIMNEVSRQDFSSSYLS